MARCGLKAALMALVIGVWAGEARAANPFESVLRAVVRDVPVARRIHAEIGREADRLLTQAPHEYRPGGPRLTSGRTKSVILICQLFGGGGLRTVAVGCNPGVDGRCDVLRGLRNQLQLMQTLGRLRRLRHVRFRVRLQFGHGCAVPE